MTIQLLTIILYLASLFAHQSVFQLNKSAVFKVVSFPPKDAQIFVIGNISILGNWDIAKALPLQSVGGNTPNLFSTLPISLQSTSATAYRYFYRFSNGTVIYEPCFAKDQECWRAYFGEQINDIFGVINQNDGFVLPNRLPTPYKLDFNPWFPETGINVLALELPIESQKAMNDAVQKDGKKPFQKIKDIQFFSSHYMHSSKKAKIRYAGQAGLYKSKKSFVIKFPDPVFGIRKIKLKAVAPDGTRSRELIMARLMEATGAIACRTGFIRLYINQQYRGLYTTIEMYDTKEFLLPRFNMNQTDSVYSCLYEDSCRIKWNSTQIDDSTITQSINNIFYEIDKQPYDEFHITPNLETAFDVDQFAKVMAINRIANNFDDYVNGNNWYLVHSKTSPILTFLSHDLEFGLTMNEQATLFPSPMHQRFLISVVHPNVRPLYERYLKFGFNLICNDMKQPLESLRRLVQLSVEEEEASLDFNQSFIYLKKFIDGRCSFLQKKYSFFSQ